MSYTFLTGAANGCAETLARAPSKPALNQRLLAGVSAVVMATILPSLAGAQALPAGCDPSTATAGSTINCVVSPPATIGAIVTNVDNLTVNIGSAATPTNLQTASNGVFMTGANALTLNILNSGSSVTGTGPATAGVFMNLTGGAGNLSLASQGSISGDGTGVDLRNSSSGALSANLVNVTGVGFNGVFASNSAAGPGLSVVSTGLVSGRFNAVNAQNLGTGALTISVADTYSAVDFAGIYARNQGADLTVTSTGTVNGAGAGIYLFQNGSGVMSINAGTVTGRAGSGIYARANSGSGVSITTTGAVNAALAGVSTRNYGTGDMVINVTDVTAGVNPGIFAANRGNNLSITSTGSVTGASTGISAFNLNSGALSLDLVNVAGTSSTGIIATNFANTTDLSIRASGAIAGGAHGIQATHSGTGAVSLAVAGVSGANGHGIWAVNNATGTDMTVVSTGLVTGSLDGIQAQQSGSGALVLNVANVTGAGPTGINATNSAAGSDLTIVSSGTVTGANIGINGVNSGRGATSISTVNAAGSVAGIFAGSTAAGTNMSVSVTGAATGATGVDARNEGRGALSVNAANATGSSGNGIFASNSAAGTGLSVVSTGTVNGTSAGINVINSGTGATSVSAVNAAGGNSAISARNTVAGTDLSVSVTGAASGATGVDARNEGRGALSVNAANAVGTGVHGIFAQNSAAGTDLSVVSTGLLSGNFNAVNAQNFGTGALTISVADTYSAVNLAGIYARNQGTGLTVTSTGTVNGAGAGVYLVQNGSGMMTVNTAGVTARANSGIYARANSGSGVSITSTGPVTGALAGIVTRNYGGGNVTINTAAVSGAVNPGIFAVNRGINLSITSSGAVSGRSTGISAINLGTGALALDVTNVIGAGSHGISASNSATGTGLTIVSSGTVIGATNGINATNSGTGALAISAANATGTNGAGIFATNSATGTDMSITVTGNATGSQTAIYARNDGTGSTTINVPSGTIGAASASSSMDMQSASMRTAQSGAMAVSGSDFGIVAIQNGTGNVQINVAGDIEGGNGGIVTTSTQGSTINVAAGGRVGSTTGPAIQTGDTGNGAADIVTVSGIVNGAINTLGGNDTVAVTAGSAVNGAIMLGDGDDTFNFSGGTVGAVRGGAGNDSANFSGAGAVINNSGGNDDVLAGFSAFNFREGNYVLTGLHQGLGATSFVGGNHTLTGTLESGAVVIGQGSGVEVGDGSQINGNVTNSGTLGLNAGGFGSFTINGNFTQTDTGTLTLDLGADGNSDRLAISGTANLGGELAINRTGFNVDPVDLIVAGNGFNGQFTSVTGLADTDLLASQTISFGPNGVQLVTQYADASQLPGLTPNQASLANSLTGNLSESSGEDSFRSFGLSVATLRNADDLIAALDQLSPELIDAGLQVAQSGQLRFLTQLLDQAGPVTAPTATMQVASLGNDTQAWPQRRAGQVWASVNLTGSEQNNGGTNLQFDADGHDVTVGVSGMGEGAVTFGLAAGFAGYETQIAGPDADRVSTDLVRVGAFATLSMNEGGAGLNAHLDAAVSIAAGSNDVRRHIVIPAIGLNTIQDSDAGFTLANIAARFTVDGMNGQDWIASPFVLVMSEALNQYADNIGRGQATALAYRSVHQQRHTLGYGVDYDRDLTPQTQAQLRGTVLHHFGDTENTIVARFSAAGAGGSDPFVTIGRDIQTQYVLEGGLSHQFRPRLTASVHAFAELGDLESQGFRLRFSRVF